jgi:hypothetical protein
MTVTMNVRTFFETTMRLAVAWAVPFELVTVTVTEYVPVKDGVHEREGEFRSGHPGGRPEKV